MSNSGAATLAKYLHRDQVRKYTSEPYWHHLERVAETTAKYLGRDHYGVDVAWLHDTVEDTDITLAELVELFDTQTVSDVGTLTSTQSVVGKNRAQRKTMDREKFLFGTRTSHIVKCADILDNVPSIVEHDPDFAEVYLVEKALMLQVLNKAPADLIELVWDSILTSQKALDNR